MNFTSDELIDRFVIGNDDMYIVDKLRIISDIVYLEEKLNNYGILKGYPSDLLLELTNKDLALCHHWQNYLYAVYFFKMVGMEAEYYEIHEPY